MAAAAHHNNSSSSSRSEGGRHPAGTVTASTTTTTAAAADATAANINDDEDAENAATTTARGSPPLHSTNCNNKRPRCSAVTTTRTANVVAAETGAPATICQHPAAARRGAGRITAAAAAAAAAIPTGWPLSRMTLYPQTKHRTSTTGTITAIATTISDDGPHRPPSGPKESSHYAAHELYTLYDHYQLVYLPAVPPPSSPQPKSFPLQRGDDEVGEAPHQSLPLLPILTPQAIPRLFSTLHVDDQHSGVVENSGTEEDGDEEEKKKTPETAKESVSGVQIGPYLARYCDDRTINNTHINSSSSSNNKNKNNKTSHKTTSNTNSNTTSNISQRNTNQDDHHDHQQCHREEPEELERGYCSFIVSQTTDGDVYNTLLQRLPFVRLPLTTTDTRIKTRQMQHGPCVWFFVGRNDRRQPNKEDNDDSGDNDNTPPLPGRPEHTDAISHNGTWHYQLSGGKIWTVRPTEELLQRWKKQKGEEEEDAAASFEIECHTGDVLLINTRLWWHATSIPSGGGGKAMKDKNRNTNRNGPSISYARDVYWNDPSTGGGGEASDADEAVAASSSRITTMTNVDGLYAANDIPSGTILFRETTMPDCELHRSATDYNCEVVELEIEERENAEEKAVVAEKTAVADNGNEEDEDTSPDDGEDGSGRMAVVSCRSIKAGEFFCLMESSDEEEDEDDDDAEEEDEDEDEFVEWRSAEEDDAEEEEK